MIEANLAYHSKVLTAIRIMAEYYAREGVKRGIRDRGEKISDYVPREISIMTHAPLVARPQELVERAKASAVVKEVRYRARRATPFIQSRRVFAVGSC